jgi:hypothetical protein
MFYLYGQVSIIQIASDKKAFIFDLIKLYEDDPKELDCCFRRIMCSSNILKLGTMFNMIKMLLYSICLFSVYKNAFLLCMVITYLLTIFANQRL